MALNLGNLVATIRLNTSQAEQALDDFRNSTGKVSDQFEEAGKKLVKAGALGVGAISGLAKAGADWEARIAGTDFLYDQLDKKIQTTISTHSKEAEALGVTQQAYKDGAVELANYYSAMGLTTEQIDSMIVSNMELIADMGAIKDIPFATVLSDWKSALMGNHEAVDKYNVALGESTMNASEYAKSIGKEVRKMSEKEKILARISVIQQQASSATGLARQEAEQFAMKLKLVIEKIKDLAGVIGQTMLPYLTPVLVMFEKLIDKIAEWVSNNQELVGITLTVVGALSALSLITGTLIVGIVSLVTNFLFWKTTFGLVKTGITLLIGKIVHFVTNLTWLSKVVALLKAPFLLMGKFFGLWGSMLSFLGSKIMWVVNLFGGWIGALGSFILNSAPVQWVLGLMSSGFALVQGAIGSAIGAIGSFLGSIGAMIMRLPLINTALTLFSRGFGLVRGAIMALASPIGIMIAGFALIGTVLLVAGDDLNAFLQKAGNFLTQLINMIAVNLPTLLQKGIEIVSFIITGIMVALPQLLAVGMDLLVMLMNGVTQNLPTIINVAVQIIQTLANFIVANLPTIIQLGVDLLIALVNGITNSLPMLVAGAVTLVVTLVQTLRANLPQLMEAGKSLLKAVFDGIVAVVGTLADAGRKIVNSILDGIKSAWGTLTGWVSSSISKIPIIGGLIKIRPEVEEPSLPNTRNVEQTMRFGLRNSLLGDLGKIGASVSSSQKVRVKTDNNNGLLQAINALSEAIDRHETTINTVVSLDGREIARGTASYMKEELETRTRRLNRLGGVL